MFQPDSTNGVCQTDGVPSTNADGFDAPSQFNGSLSNALLNELAQVRSLEQERINRIYELEQALDQALAFLADLRLQLQEHEILEAQLVKTEAFASVQHRAIATFKQQLLHLQHIVQMQDQLILHLSLWRMLQPQPTVDVTLPRQLSLPLDGNLDQDITTLMLQLDAAHNEIQQLAICVAELEAQSTQSSFNTDERQVLELTLRQTKALLGERNSLIATLEKDQAIAQIKVEELEIQLAKQHKIQLRWQHNIQELEGERDRYRARILEQEQEIAAMQEQIVQQARQANEYEMAVQHWKDRYLSSQRQMAQLKELIEQAFPQSLTEVEADPGLTPGFAELLEALRWLVTTEPSDPIPFSVLPSPRFSKLDIPDFLIRRRKYRAQP